MTNRDPLVETAFPELSKKSRRELEYSNTEYLYDIYGATDYTTTAVLINPGLMESFPMLSGMATQFETYRFTKLEFYYKPFVASMLSSSNTQLGFIGMTHCTDANEVTQSQKGTSHTIFPSKASFLNYEGSISAKPSTPLKFVVDCNKYHKQNLYYVRQGEYSNIDLRLSDMGSFVWSCGDQQSPGLMGEMYVKYTVKFLKSKPAYSLANSNKFAHFRLSGTINASNAFGTVQTPQPGTNIHLEFGKNGTTTQYFALPQYPALCNYVCYLEYRGDNGNWEIDQPNFGNPTGIPILANGTQSINDITGTSDVMSMTYFFNTPDNIGQAGIESLKILFSQGASHWGFLNNITSADLFVMQIPAYSYSIP